MAKGTVQGRLNRETNPIPGEKPGFNPQFIDSDGYATDVTPNTPFPSGGYVQTNSGVWVPQKGSDDGAAHVQLTGRNVEIVDFFDAYAITDTEEYSVSFWIGKYKKIYIVATNTHDTSIRLDFRFNHGSTSRYWNGSEWVIPRVDLPSAAFPNRYLVNPSLSFLDNVISDRLWVVAKANTIPSQGSLTVKLFGVIN